MVLTYILVVVFTRESTLYYGGQTLSRANALVSGPHRPEYSAMKITNSAHWGSKKQNLRGPSVMYMGGTGDSSHGLTLLVIHHIQGTLYNIICCYDDHRNPSRLERKCEVLDFHVADPSLILSTINILPSTSRSNTLCAPPQKSSLPMHT